MNVYLLIEDGEGKCFVASSMQAATQIAENLHIADLDQDEYADGSEESERNYYRSTILGSCTFIGKLAAIETDNTEAHTAAVIKEIADERKRQIQIKGWTPEHDDEHDSGDLCASGAAYALNAGCLLNPHNGTPIEEPETVGWMFGPSWWKPTTPRRDLIKAAALIVAEIERLDRNA